MNLSRTVKKLCPPARFYLGISIFMILLVMVQNLFNNNSSELCFGSYKADVSSLANVTVLFIAKILYIVLWTWVLNILCRKGLASVSWFLVLLPFMLFAVGLSQLVFTKHGMYSEGFTTDELQTQLNAANIKAAASADQVVRLTTAKNNANADKVAAQQANPKNEKKITNAGNKLAKAMKTLTAAKNVAEADAAAAKAAADAAAAKAAADAADAIANPITSHSIKIVYPNNQIFTGSLEVKNGIIIHIYRDTDPSGELLLPTNAVTLLYAQGADNKFPITDGGVNFKSDIFYGGACRIYKWYGNLQLSNGTVILTKPHGMSITIS